MSKLIIFTVLLFTKSCTAQLVTSKSSREKQEEIIEKYLRNGAWNYHYLTKEWEEWVDKGIKEDSTIAYLWQQKALPYWKQRKYEQAILFYQKAVKYDEQVWLSRLAFLKCIFAKDYKGALNDLEDYVIKYGSVYEQDHTLEFYISLCHLQLGNLEMALATLSKDIEKVEKEKGANWVHFVERFYLGIIHLESGELVNAILQFNKVLTEYPSFSDAQYYKALCLNYLGEVDLAKKLLKVAKENHDQGFSFTEDSAQYELYPYQVSWEWRVANSIIK